MSGKIHDNSEQREWVESEPSGDSDSDRNDYPFKRSSLRGIHTISWRETGHGNLFRLFDFPRREWWVSSIQSEFHPRKPRGEFVCLDITSQEMDHTNLARSWWLVSE